MPDIKWIKITSYIFEDEKIRLIDAMENGVMVIYVWLRLLVQAGKINANGYIYLTENIPYTEDMLATLFCKPLESIKFALKTLCDFQMIEIDSNKIIKILNWEKHQNVEGMERVRAQNRKRAENHREKKKQIEQAAKEKFEDTIGNNANCEEEKENFENINVQEEKTEKLDNIIEGNNSAVELDNSEVSSKDNIGHDSNVTEDTNSNKNSRSNGIVKKSCKDNNSTCDDKKSTCNVTVTEQNKKEIKNKKKIKRESNNTLDIKNKEPTYEKKSEGSTLSKMDNLKNNSIAIAADKNMNFEEGNKAIADKFDNSSYINKTTGTQGVNSKALEILMHYEKLTGIPGVFNQGSIALAIDMHGEKFVKMAINKALELNKTDMPYRDVITKIKQNMLDAEYYCKMISKYQLCEVLLIDDLFKGKINESDLNIMFEIINYRYLNFLPIIVSSEFSIDRLLAFDEGVGSRIYEMAKNYVVEIEKDISNNYRLK